MVSLSTLLRWSATAAIAGTMISACSKPVTEPPSPKEPCYSTCVAHMKRCLTLCKEANEECTGNAKYMAQLKATQVHSFQKPKTNIDSYLHLGQCNSNCGCVPSPKVCHDLCEYASA